MGGLRGTHGSTGGTAAAAEDFQSQDMAAQRAESFQSVLKLVLLEMNCFLFFSKRIQQGMIIKTLL